MSAGAEGLVKLLTVPAALHAAVKADGLFLVRRKHQDAEAEAGVADHDGFLIVRDIGG